MSPKNKSDRTFIQQFCILKIMAYSEFLKFLNSKYVILFLDPELHKKSATRFIPRWNLMNKTFIPLFCVGICMGGTLRMSNFKTLSIFSDFWTPI
jgi:hypothetical protein